MASSYLGRLFDFAFRRFVIRTDAVQILVAVFLPAVFKLLGVPMPTEAMNEVFAYIAYAALAFVALRLLIAPYFIWREDQVAIVTLRGQLDASNNDSRKQTIAYTTELKHKVAHQLSAHAETAFRRDNGVRSKAENEAYLARQEFIKASAIQLSQDQELYSDLLTALNLVDCVTADKLERVPNEKDRAELDTLTKKLIRKLLGT